MGGLSTRVRKRTRVQGFRTAPGAPRVYHDRNSDRTNGTVRQEPVCRLPGWGDSGRPRRLPLGRGLLSLPLLRAPAPRARNLEVPAWALPDLPNAPQGHSRRHCEPDTGRHDYRHRRLRRCFRRAENAHLHGCGRVRLGIHTRHDGRAVRAGRLHQLLGSSRPAREVPVQAHPPPPPPLCRNHALRGGRNAPGRTGRTTVGVIRAAVLHPGACGIGRGRPALRSGLQRRRPFRRQARLRPAVATALEVPRRPPRALPCQLRATPDDLGPPVRHPAPTESTLRRRRVRGGEASARPPLAGSAPRPIPSSDTEDRPGPWQRFPGTRRPIFRGRCS